MEAERQMLVDAFWRVSRKLAGRYVERWRLFMQSIHDGYDWVTEYQRCL